MREASVQWRLGFERVRLGFEKLLWPESEAAAARGERLGSLQQFPNFILQGKTFFVPKIGEPERLLIALRGPHRKQHRRFASYRPGAQVQRQADRDSLVEAAGQFQQSPGNRNPNGLGPQLSSIFQLDGRGSVSPQIDARGAEFSAGVGEVGHLQLQLCHAILIPRRLRKPVRKSDFTRLNSYNTFRNLPLVGSA
jgi:hypothetical protein